MTAGSPGSLAWRAPSLPVTIHHHDLHLLKQQTLIATVLPGVRYTEGGETSNILTSAGVSAGIDLAFYFVGKLLGRDAAVKTARLMEYNGTVNFAVGNLAVG